jgi:hypothetical protein
MFCSYCGVTNQSLCKHLWSVWRWPCQGSYSQQLIFYLTYKLTLYANVFCYWQASPALCNVTLKLIGRICKFWRKLSVVNTVPYLYLWCDNWQPSDNFNLIDKWKNAFFTVDCILEGAIEKVNKISKLVTIDIERQKIDCLRFVMCPLLATGFQGFFFYAANNSTNEANKAVRMCH